MLKYMHDSLVLLEVDFVNFEIIAFASKDSNQNNHN